MDLRSRPPICLQDDPLYEILNRFQTGKSECVQILVCGPMLTVTDSVYRHSCYPKCIPQKQ